MFLFSLLKNKKEQKKTNKSKTSTVFPGWGVGECFPNKLLSKFKNRNNAVPTFWC